MEQRNVMGLWERFSSLLLGCALFLCALFLLTACGNETAGASGAARSAASAAGGQKVLVAYFSHTGKTKAAAEYIHGIVGGDLVELTPAKDYPAGYHDALEPAKEEQREGARPALATKIENFDSYDVIYLGYPIWWGTDPMLINTFLESYDFSGKTVVPFATSGGSSIDRSVEDIRGEIPKAHVTEGLLIRDTKDVRPWLERVVKS